MKQQLPDRANARQLRVLAKELLRQLPTGSKLADAQFELAKRYGFDSWPKLIRHVEGPELTGKIRHALETGDANALEKLLKSSALAREMLNEPILPYDTQPVVWASRCRNAEQTLAVLIRYGADPNARSKWWAGGFSALDMASPEVAEVLQNLGARYDVWSASQHGKLDVLCALIESDPSLINSRGGDGKTPLHFSGTPEVARWLIAQGADLTLRDVDHESTAAQHLILETEILRVLVDAGAEVDAFIAVSLDDVSLLEQLHRTSPDSIRAKVGEPPFVTTSSSGGHIYEFQVGRKVNPIQFAAAKSKEKALAWLAERAEPEQVFIAAVRANDLGRIDALLSQHQGLVEAVQELGFGLADVTPHGSAQLVQRLVSAGFSPMQPGLDAGTALHVAAWYGRADLVPMLVDGVPLDMLDPTHGSSPLSWALHGSNHCRNPQGDYLAVVELLMQLGADTSIPANKNGVTMMAMAGSRDDVRALLRTYGVR